MILCRDADVPELQRVKLDAWLAQQLLQKEATDKMADGEPVRLGDLINVIGRDHAPRPSHIVDDEDRIAGDIFSHMASDQAGISVVTAACREADYEADRLALIEVRLCSHAFGTAQQNEAQ